MTLSLLLPLLLIFSVSVSAFYLPGVAPKDYKIGDSVQLKVNKLDSIKTQLPYDYYTLPFCRPKDGIVQSAENLGEILSGDSIENSPYKVSMKHVEACKILCRRTYSSEELKEFSLRIEEEYYVNWIVDNLPAVTKYYTEDGSGGFQTNYEKGFPLGFVGSREIPDSKPGVVYMNNHLRLTLLFHKPDPLSSWGSSADPNSPAIVDGIRIVGFEVEAFSVKHEIDGEWRDGDTQLATCDPLNKVSHRRPAQPVSGNPGDERDRTIIWTYDVQWVHSDIKWASRWDVYLRMTGTKIHWFSILNSIVIVVFLTAIVALIMVKTLRRDFSAYNRPAQDDEEAEAQALDESGWKLVSHEVFRPPRFGGLFAVFVGSGAQVLAMATSTIFFAVMGLLSPSTRGGLLIALLLMFVFTGSIGGYVSTRIFTAFGMTRWKHNSLFIALFFPGYCFATFFVMDLAMWYEQSTGAVPFLTLVALQLLWFGISMPLVYLGSTFAARKAPLEPPYRTNTIPRMVPEQQWYLQAPFSVLAGAVLPFGAVFIELFFIMTSVWMHRFYYAFGFLFIVMVILIVTCAEISMVGAYFQLCAEDYNWWWRSFLTPGTSGLYVFLYSIVYFFTRLDITEAVPTLLYFGYMSIASLAFFLLTGAVGFLATVAFVHKIYTSIKVD